MAKVLWLSKFGKMAGLKKLQQNYILKAGFQLSEIHYGEFTTGCMQKKGKTKFVVNPELAANFHLQTAKVDCDVLVCNDQASLFYITNKYQSLDLCRGSVFYYTTCSPKHPHYNKPVIVIDAVQKTKSTKHGAWMQLMDMRKAHRWANGKQWAEPKFQFTVCKSLSLVQKLLTYAKDTMFMGVDIETTVTTISSIQYTCLKRSGEIHTFVVPFYYPVDQQGTFWTTAEDEIVVWKLIKKIHQTSAYKTMQNGSYDSAYFIKYHLPFKNYLFDSQHMWHSIWPESPKRLDVIASIALDHIRYWKDEGKEEDVDNKASKVPRSAEGMENYWLYGAMDSHNTLLSTKWIMQILSKMEWARTNYVKEFTLQFGACLSMTMRGMKVDKEIHRKLILNLSIEHHKANQDLIAMVGDEFNPNSPAQVAHMVYDILGAKELPRKGKSTNKTNLKLIAGQSFLLGKIINQIFAVKEPKNNISKYSDGIFLGERFMYQLKTATTPTGRLASSAHNFWVGTNAQNLPKTMRPMLEADKGYFILDLDYSQSDAYFTAFESEDPLFIQTMLSGKDTHCVHAEEFFKVPYEKILEAKKNGEDWVVHASEGIRNITKRIVYGSNYFMSGYTLLIQMGIKSVIAAAKFLGHENAAGWTIRKMADFCNALLETHYRRYPGIKANIQREAVKATRNGNKATCAFGYTRLFFGDLVYDDKNQREFAAFFGQGGTAGNINKAINTIFWSLESQGVMLLNQVHDSLILQIPQDRLDLAPVIKSAMENVCLIKGQEFTIPVEAEIGVGWGKRLMDWKPEITSAEIFENDNVWKAKFFGKSNLGNRALA